jgi:hypothetical protein
MTRELRCRECPKNSSLSWTTFPTLVSDVRPSVEGQLLARSIEHAGSDGGPPALPFKPDDGLPTLTDASMGVLYRQSSGADRPSLCSE